QVPPSVHAGVNAATEMVVGPVRVVLAVFAQSRWKRYSFKLFVPNSRMSFGAPAGGDIAPSLSDGSMPPSFVPSVLHCCVAGGPAGVSVRSTALISGPRTGA